MEVQSILDLVINLVILAAIAALGYGARQLIVIGVQYLRAKLGEAQYQVLLERARSVVRYLAQDPAYRNWDGKEKKEYALGALERWLESRGLDFDFDEVDEAIEREVFEVKSMIVPLFGEPEDPPEE